MSSPLFVGAAGRPSTAAHAGCDVLRRRPITRDEDCERPRPPDRRAARARRGAPCRGAAPRARACGRGRRRARARPRGRRPRHRDRRATARSAEPRRRDPRLHGRPARGVPRRRWDRRPNPAGARRHAAHAPALGRRDRGRRGGAARPHARLPVRAHASRPLAAHARRRVARRRSRGGARGRGQPRGGPRPVVAVPAGLRGTGRRRRRRRDAARVARVGVPPDLQLRILGFSVLVDVALAPIGLLAAVATPGGVLPLLMLMPLIGLLAVLGREREQRIQHTIELSDAYRGTALLMGEPPWPTTPTPAASTRRRRRPLARRRQHLGLGARDNATSSSARCCTTAGRSASPTRSSTSPAS